MQLLFWRGKNLFKSLPRRLFCTGRLELQDELHQDDLKEKDEFIPFFKIVQGKIVNVQKNFISCKWNDLGKLVSAVRNGTNSYPRDDLCLFFCLYPSYSSYMSHSVRGPHRKLKCTYHHKTYSEKTFKSNVCIKSIFLCKHF